MQVDANGLVLEGGGKGTTKSGCSKSAGHLCRFGRAHLDGAVERQGCLSCLYCGTEYLENCQDPLLLKAGLPGTYNSVRRNYYLWLV